MVSRRRWTVAVAGVCLAVAAGCSSGSSSDDASTSGAVDRGGAVLSAPSESEETTSVDALAAPTTIAPFAGQAEDGDASGSGGEVAPPPDAIDATPAAIGRSVVSTALVTVESDNVIEARQRTVAIAESAGGAIFEEQTELGDKGRTTITLRVPPDQFQSVLSQLGQVGELTTQDVSTEDVTSQVVDLDARIASAEVSVERMRGFLAQATSVSEIADLERQLVARETNLETLRGQKRTLDGRVDLATIVLTVQPPTGVPAPPPPPQEATSPPGFLDGLSGGWEVLVSGLTVVGAVAGWLLPFVPFAAVFALAIIWHRRRNPAPTTTPVDGPPPPQPVS